MIWHEHYAVPRIADTVKASYYVVDYFSIAKVSPIGIIPKGRPVDYPPPHDRMRLPA